MKLHGIVLQGCLSSLFYENIPEAIKKWNTERGDAK